MKKFLLIFFTLLSVQVFAQDNANQPPAEAVDKAKIAQTIDALKVAYITKELNLSTDEAQKFWPLYNGLSGEMKKARMEFKQDDIAFEEKKVMIMKKYRDDFKKLLNNDDRVKKCFRAEPEFHKLLRNEWMRRHNDRPLQQQRVNPNPRVNDNHRQDFKKPDHTAPNGGKTRN